MGLSGSGKSTLVRTLIRLIEPTAGAIEIAGQDVTGASGRAARAAPQLGLDGLPALRPARAPPRDRQRRLRARDPRGPEGGATREGQRGAPAWSGSRTSRTRSRPALRRHAAAGRRARAFVGDPTVMLYDEPFSALDPLIRRDMQDEVMRLQTRRARRWSSSLTTCPRLLPPSARGSRSCATARSCSVLAGGACRLPG